MLKVEMLNLCCTGCGCCCCCAEDDELSEEEAEGAEGWGEAG
jgi:hypothetical protein